MKIQFGLSGAGVYHQRREATLRATARKRLEAVWWSIGECLLKTMTILILAPAMLLSLSGCKDPNAPLSPEAARAELKRKGVKYDKETFLKSAEDGDTDLVKLFLDAGMDPNITDEENQTPLMRAATTGTPRLVKILIARGADVNARDWNNATALALAAWVGNSESILILLDAGADINAIENHGFTPLHYAALAGHYRCVSILLERGANMNAQDESGNTAIIFLANFTKAEDRSVKEKIASSIIGSDRIQAAKILLEKGADLNIRNKAGKTALMIAEEKGNAEMAELLKKAGATQ
jgi:ankyrin repeat protein